MLHDKAAITPRAARYALAASVFVFAVLAFVISNSNLEGVECDFLFSLRDATEPAVLNGPGWLSYFMLNVTALGGWPLMTVFSALLAFAFALARRWSFLFILLAVVTGESVITGLLKDLFARARPDVVPHLIYASSSSFPSGHAASAAAVYFTAGLALANMATRKALRLYIFAASLSIVFLIGISRVYLGVHYPSDVIAGWCVGAAWASIVWLVAWRIEMGGPGQRSSSMRR